MVNKVLLDTDIGSDIDDVLCLTYLLNNPDCEILGITTVTGEPEKRARIARNLCHHANKSIPVISGRSVPLLISQHQPIAEQSVAINDWIDVAEDYSLDAIDFLRQSIRKYPHEVDLLAIGPLTNIALLFLIDPEISSLLKSLTMMCGCFFDYSLENVKVEWNALCDPQAAAIVYRTPVEKQYSIGLDVTQKVTMSAEEFREIFSNSRQSYVLDFAEIWLKKENTVTFHDPLAASFIFQPELIEFKKGLVQIETSHPRISGLTEFSEDYRGPHNVAIGINSKKFFSHFFSLFT